MSFPDGAPLFPPLSPPPLSTPAGVERGAWILLRRAGDASTARGVAAILAGRDWRGNGRSQRLVIGSPRLTAAPASNGTKDDVTSLLPCFAHGRPHSGRRWGCAAVEPLTTTAAPKSPPSFHGGDGSFHRSLSRTPEAKPEAPSPARRGGRGRGERVGKEMRHIVVQRLARESAHPKIRGN